MLAGASSRGDTGAALPIGLLLLTATTLLALAGTRLSRLELLVSLNDERQAQAQQQAQSLVDAAMIAFRNTPPLASGERRCLLPVADADPGGSCGHAALPDIPIDEQTGNHAGASNITVTRLSPASSAPPVGSGFSAARFGMVQISVAGIFDGTAHGLGSARIDEGMAILVAQPAGVSVLRDPGS